MLDEAVIRWLVVLSIATFVLTLVIVPVLLVRLPSDYFVREHRDPSLMSKRHPVVRIVILIAKNTLGAVLVLGGIAMLVMPGQGVLSILIGLSLIDFPGKFALERRIVRRKSVHRSINWIRKKANKEAMEIPE